eukprot:4491213-Prymnesium_polylepis.1
MDMDMDMGHGHGTWTWTWDMHTQYATCMSVSVPTYEGWMGEGWVGLDGCGLGGGEGLDLTCGGAFGAGGKGA